MKNRKRVAFLLAMVIVFSSLLSGCKSEPKPVENTNSNEKAEEQVLDLIFENPFSLDVNDAKAVFDFQILTEVQEALVRVLTDEKGNEVPTPAGAEKWEVSEDGLVWTFSIREQKWSDGVPVIAQQYVDSIQRLLDPENAFSYAFFAYDIKNAQAYYNGNAKKEDIGVRAINDKTLEITLEKVTPQFEKKLGFICMAPIRLDVIQAAGETWASDETKQVYCGPFVIKEWIKDNSMVLEKNPYYWDAENVSLQTVNLTVVSEISTRAQLFESKQIDLVEGNQDYIKKWSDMAKNGEFREFIGTNPGLWFTAFNQTTGGTTGLMANSKIRLALSLALDRDEFAKTVFGRYYGAWAEYPFGIQVGDTDFRGKYEQTLKTMYEKDYKDNVKLQALFKEGLKELGKSEDLSKVALTYIATGSDSQSRSLQEYLKQTWENRLGIKIDMQVFGDNLLLRDVRKSGKWDMLYTMWTGDYNDPMTFADLWINDSGFGEMFGGYSSEEYNTIFARLEGEADNAVREQIYADLENQLVVKDVGIMPCVYTDSIYYIHNNVKNLSTPIFGQPLDFSRAYITK